MSSAKMFLPWNRAVTAIKISAMGINKKAGTITRVQRSFICRSLRIPRDSRAMQ